MSKFEVSYTDDSIVFVNTKTNKVDSKEQLFDAFDDNEAINAQRKEQGVAVSASKGAVSLLVRMLDNPRLDAYRGTCPTNESPCPELKAAIRELETEYLKPKFIQPLIDKGAKPATAEKQWQDFAKGLKAGGSYAVAKGHITKLFAYTGELPTHNGKCLTVAAVVKLLSNLERETAENEGIAGKLVKLSEELTNADSDKMGDFATAIAALKSMLLTYENQYSQALEILTDAIGNTELTRASNMAHVSIDDQAKAITAKAIAQTKHVRHATMTHNDVDEATL